MTLRTRTAGKANVAATIYTNATHDVSGNEIRNSDLDLWDSAFIPEARDVITSAATTDLSTSTSDSIQINGTATITSFGVAAAGRIKLLLFANVATLTHSSAILCPGNANIATATGDVAVLVSEGSGDWRIAVYQRRSGKAIIAPAAAEISNATATGISAMTAASAAALATAAGVGAADSPTHAALTLSGGQIAFPATQVPSANANTLDDYEEGTFTPTLSASTTPPTGVTYSTQVGNYTKIGNVVHIRARVVLSSKGSSGVGNVLIGALPFTVNDPGTPVNAGALRSNLLTFSAGYTQVVCAPVRASTNVAVIEQGSGVVDQQSVWANMVNTTAFIFSASYAV